MADSISIVIHPDLYNRALRWAGIDDLTLTGDDERIQLNVSGVYATRAALNKTLNALVEIYSAQTGGRGGPDRHTIELAEAIEKAKREATVNGVYAVLVSPDISDDPVRWLFVDEISADELARAINNGRPHGGAWVTYEPIAEDIDDPQVLEAFPDETAQARRAVRT